MINDYTEVKECVYKDECYSVRDNGAVMRHLREGKRPRKDDDVWTFGIKNPRNGYMHFGNANGHRVHIIVATAFLGARDSKIYVVDHIDTNRCNNRVENLRWFTRLENALNNEITRNKIIYLCGSIEAFIENPSILRERLVGEPSLEWMRTVTKEEAAIAYENIKQFWAEQAQRPKPLVGGKLNESVYRKQQIVDRSASMVLNCENLPLSGKLESDFVVSNEEWLQMTLPLRKPNSESDFSGDFVESKPHKRYIMSHTPKAAQMIHFIDDRPCYYPSTPQEDSDNPLQTYAERLSPGSVFWQNHEGKRDHIVEKCSLSSSGNSLIVMYKAAYIWGSRDGEDCVEIPISTLSREEYNDDDLNRQLAEIIYEDGVFIHQRAATGFMPKEYLAQLYDELISR